MCFNVSLGCYNINSVLAVVATGDITDTDYFCSCFLEEECVVCSDVAEALYDDRCCLGVYFLCFEKFKDTCCNAESGRCRAAL